MMTVSKADLQILAERIDALDRLLHAALDASTTALTKAELVTENRFHAVNDFREAMNDQGKRMLTRAEYDSAHTRLEESMDQRFTRYEDRIADLQAAQSRVIGVALGATLAISTLGVLVSIVLNVLHV